METYGDFWVRLQIFYLLGRKESFKKRLRNEDGDNDDDN